jgi:hypothetical protein
MELKSLSLITEPMYLDDLSPEQVLDLQTALAAVHYSVGTLDGQFGPRTSNAWAEFKADYYYGSPKVIEPGSVDALKALAALNGAPSTGQAAAAPAPAAVPAPAAAPGTAAPGSKQATIDAIVAACTARHFSKQQIAYVLATTQWESAGTFKPVREGLSRSDDWRRQNLRYYPYYGRGYVQITWDYNYKKFGARLGIDLLNQPDLALQHEYALPILLDGFEYGLFTGRKIADYINANGTDFPGARRCINGTDRASEIAALAQKFLAQL